MHQRADSAAILELLTFRVNGQAFAVDGRTVRELRGWTPSTPVPAAPPYVQGVVNLRGAVLPIVDLNLRLGFPAQAMTDRHVVIVSQTGRRLVGAVADEVMDITPVAASDVRPTPSVAPAALRSLFEGVISQADGGVVILLAFDALIPDG